MRTAVDSSVLFCILRGEPEADLWLDLLIQRAARGPLIICEIVAAEVATAFPSIEQFRSFTKRMELVVDPSSVETCYLAGHVYQEYRRRGGKRDRLAADFLVAAHAKNQAQALGVLDRGFARTYFPKLLLLDPKVGEG
jgi:predicted nucleic acid-binding protein